MKEKKSKNNISKKAISLILIFAYTIICPCSAFADNFGDSKIATGTSSLISDITSWGQIIAPVAGILCVIYFQVRKGAADQQDAKDWQKRTNTAIVCVIIAELAGTIINLVLKYYQ